jgi:Uma2 family endonuclease
MTTARQAHPPQGQWTLEAFDALPEDKVRRELVDGVLIELATPRRDHQKVGGRLFARLDATCPPRYDVVQENEILISPTQVRCPDILVTTYEAGQRNDYRYLPEEMLLAVEIESPSTKKTDRLVKPEAYAQAGIPNYWRISPGPPVTVYIYQLDPVRMAYWLTAYFDDVIKVDRPWEIELPVAEISPR